MATYNEMIGSHMAIATGDDSGGGAGLTAWRNADAAYVSGELKACDIPLGWNFKPLHYTTARTGTMSTSRVRHRYSVNRNAGTWMSKHAFQSVQFCWWLMQTPGTPTSGTGTAKTHTLSINGTGTASCIPKWHGIHFERESIASNELRYDLMGLCPQDLTITCNGAEQFDAIQEINIPYANKVAGSDIAAQTQRPYQTTGTRWKTWNDLISGNGAGKSANLTGMLYNTGSLEIDVIGMKIGIHRDVALRVPDTSGLFTVGRMYGLDYYLELEAQPVGDVIYGLNGLKKESYAGDLDFDFSFKADDTADKNTFAFDKMYMLEFDEVNDYNKHLESYTLRFEPFDKDSSLTITGIDTLDNTNYENP